MEYLDYLIRTLTYQRSCWELNLKKLDGQSELTSTILYGKIEGLNFAISEIYKLTAELDKIHTK